MNLVLIFSGAPTGCLKKDPATVNRSRKIFPGDEDSCFGGSVQSSLLKKPQWKLCLFQNLTLCAVMETFYRVHLFARMWSNEVTESARL